MTLKLPLLQPDTIVDGQGVPTAIMQSWWQQVVQSIEGNEAGLADAVDQVAMAQAAIIIAQESAADAQTTADGKLDEATADTLYVHQNATPTWAAPTGTLSRSGLSTYTSPGAGVAYDQAQIDALMTAVQTMSRLLAALLTDLRAVKALST